jgi:hypothetical protein
MDQIKITGPDSKIINMAGQKPGGHHNPVARRAWYEKILQQDSIQEFENKFDKIDKNIKEVEKMIGWRDLDQKVSVSDEFLKMFGLKK